MIRHLPIIKIQNEEKKNLSKNIDFIIEQLEINEGKLTDKIKEKIIEINDNIFEYFSVNGEERELMINKVKEINKFYKLIY